MVWEYLPVAKPPHASLRKHCGIAPSNVSWHVLQYVALVDSGEKSSSTSMSLEKTNGWSPWPPMKSIVWGAPLYPRRKENKKLPSRKISLPIAMQPCVDTAPGTHCCHLTRHLPALFCDTVDGEKFFFEIRNACILFSSPIICELSRVLSLKNGPSPKIT